MPRQFDHFEEDLRRGIEHHDSLTIFWIRQFTGDRLAPYFDSSR